MQFLILGTLEVRNAAGVVELGGSKPRAVMAMLLLHPNAAVPVERLVHAVWGAETPPNAVRNLQVYVARLRRALGDTDVLARAATGYRLRVAAGELDAERFASLVADGRQALSDAEPERAATLLREALALWRGPALPEHAHQAFAERAIAILDEQRVAALNARVEADLAAGRHVELVAELRRIVAGRPEDERFPEHLMLALYRCGQQAAALEAYHATRRALATQSALKPFPRLRELEQAILRQDPGLDWRPATRELPPQLDPDDAPGLAGRATELAWLRERWARAREGAGGLVTVSGVSGIGKTRLVSELAAEVHRLGAAVLHADGTGSDSAILRAAAKARRSPCATLLVVDDADRAGQDVIAALADLETAAATRSLLVIVTACAAERLARLGADDALALGPLGAEAVSAIADEHDPRPGDADVPIEWLLQASGGIPREVHGALAGWARQEAVRRVEEAAGRTASGREELRKMELDLASDVQALQEATGRTGVDDETPVVCPFKGLASFDASDAPYFFGREDLVRELVVGLVGQPLLAIVGPSGSGKSSVLRAGLLPGLASGMIPTSETWSQLVIRPGEHPLRELARLSPVPAGQPPLVVAVDQFEETFTVCRDEAERAAFVAGLARLALDRERPLKVVLAVRADYYGRCAPYPELSRLMAANHMLVGPMRRDELRKAIELPAQRAKLRVDPELTDALVADVEDELAGLPLLSAALLELWRHRDGPALRYRVYEQMGGVRGAVARLADSAFAQLDAAGREKARSVLLRLVAVGADGTIERRRVPLSELAGEDSEDVERVIAALTDHRLLTVDTDTVEFAHEALLREWPLLREWIESDRESLRIQRSLTSAATEWRALGRDPEALYRGVRLARTIEWRDARGPRLNEVEREFLEASEADTRHRRGVRRRSAGLVVAALSIGLVAAVVAALFAGNQRDVAQSRDLASKSAAVVASDPPLALALALEALNHAGTEQAQGALRQATLADRATRIIPTGQPLALGLAVSPNGHFVAVSGGDHAVPTWNVASGRRGPELQEHAKDILAVTYSEDGKLIATSARNGEIAVAPANGGMPRVVARLKGREYAPAVDFGPDAGTLAIGTDHGRVALVSVRDGSIRDLAPHRGAYVFSVAMDNDGRRVVSAGDDGVARIWGLDGGAPLALAHGTDRSGQPQWLLAATFSPDGGTVATVDSYGSVILWSASNGRETARIGVSDSQQASVQFSADGRRIVTAGRDGGIHVSELRDHSTVATLRGHKGPARAAFVPDGGGTIVSAGEEDGTVRTWPAATTKVPPQPGFAPRFDGSRRLVVSVDPEGAVHVWNPATGEDRTLRGLDGSVAAALSPDGAHVVAASDAGPVRRWALDTGRSQPVRTLGGAKYAVAVQPGTNRIAIGGESLLVIQAADGSAITRLSGHAGRVNSLAFSPDGRRLLSGSDDKTARIWNAAKGTLERTLSGQQGVIRGVAYSEDGRRVATAGSDGTIAVWSVDGGEPVILAGHDAAVNSVAFSPRGDRLVSAADDGTIRVWKASGGGALVTLEQYAGIASGADFGRSERFVVSAGADSMRLSLCDVCGSFAQASRVADRAIHHSLTALERRRLLPEG